MNNSKLINVIIGTLIVLNLLLLLKLNSNNTYINELKEGIVKINENHISTIGKADRLTTNLETSFIDAGKRLEIFDSELFGKKDHLLVLRIHENNCNDCVKQSLVYLNRLVAEKTKSPFNIAVSTSYNSIEALRQDFDVKFLPIHQIPEINLDMDFTLQPYVFLVSREGFVSNVFVPEFDSMELFAAYLQSLLSMQRS